MPVKPTVFISYSHMDEAWKDRFKPHLEILEQLDRLTIWDDRRIDGGDTWYPEIKEAMEKASIAICLISSDFLASTFCVKEEVPFLMERRKNNGMVLIPVLLRSCLWEAIPWLKELQMLPRDGKTITDDFKDNWDVPFKDVAQLVYEIIDNPVCKPPTPVSSWAALPEERISIERLPVTGAELFGRHKEMELLDEAWNKHNLNAISFVAWGGVGKSTLVNKWLDAMKTDNYRGAKHVFGWSFYSQGTGKRVTSADLFIAEALKWFGDPDPNEGSPWDKGQRLAELIKKEKTLLVLDGIEPLQSTYDFEKGKTKDPALSVLVNELSRENPGLLIITTREEIPELKELNELIVQKNLEQITPEAGRALLRTAGVRGTDNELEDASRAFGNHALALRLLGSYLYEEEGHRIDHVSKIPGLEHIPEDKGRHPRRVMAAFEERFGDGPEKELLRMLGLFDRPAEQGAINALLDGKAIPNLTGHFKKLTGTGQKKLLLKLQKLKLIAEQDKNDSRNIDTHPLVRQHFSEQLNTYYRKAWRDGNNRLYEYFKTQAPEFPETIEEMSPLFSAVAHGCAAERYQKALDDVYWKRIRREYDAFSVRELGAFGSDLACLSHFFKEQWHIPVAALDQNDKPFVSNEAGYCLRALGRIKEAIEPMQASLKMYISQKDWENAGAAALNLSELYLAIGKLDKAIDCAKKGVQYADKSKVPIAKRDNRAALADALHQAGHIEKAETLFLQAEAIQKKDLPEYPYLDSAPGYLYCSFLIEKENYKEVLERANQTIDIANDNSILLDIARDHLSLGHAYLLKTLKECNKDYLEAENHLNSAVDGLRMSGNQDDVPRGLLTRADLYCIKKEFKRAGHDLDEVMSIASRSEMKLYEADCHLGYARLHLAMDNKAKAREHHSIAKEMINEMGYHRRDKDVKEIEKLLESIAE